MGQEMELRLIPVSRVQGVGTRRQADLAGIGIETVEQLLEYFPFRYEDYRLRDLTEVKDGEKITVQATIHSEPFVQMYGPRKSRMTLVVAVDSFLVTSVWFNRHFMKDRLRPGQEIVLTGKWEQHQRRLTVAEAELPGGQGAGHSGTLQPVYSLGGEVTQRWLRKVIRQALVQYGDRIPEILPEELLRKYKLLSRRDAIRLIHQPGGFEDGRQARRRLVYEELFLFQLKLQIFRTRSRNRADGVQHQVDSQDLEQFIAGLPFQLTASQAEVVQEIVHDLRQPYCMNRLLQGDVGSGKTIVAAISLYATIKAGCQGALMVPTEILAEQHKHSLDKLFEPYGFQIALLTGQATERQRRDVLAALQLGLIQLVVGTHALIQEDVIFRQLGLVVIDEQHRFGVNQRSILRRKGMNPDVLAMTATPIPRTLAITAFGDMDVSTLRELPSGRKPVKTYSVSHDMFERVIHFIGNEVAAGRQAYVVCPLIEESDKLDVQNAIDVYQRLSGDFPQYQVGLLHGRMQNQEKEQVMRSFNANEIQILVTTTVVEVGVDVPNATLMVVYDADRFGLSQLHQLRGRVGRGQHQSYCVLIADPKGQIGKERMQVMTETNDGFEIARRDLELRGPGDFFGTRQSGLPDFKVADMSTDFHILEIARDDAASLVGQTEFWTSAAYLTLRQYMQRDQMLEGDPLD